MQETYIIVACNLEGANGEVENKSKDIEHRVLNTIKKCI